ncbi:MAG: ATP-binding cassette domain-containing protein [Akkermansia sp.]|nr:ATP-binding cassette domain-containing protein [Akkermansia sp.]
MTDEQTNILEVYKLSMHFPVHNNLLPIRKSIVKAVDEVSFSIAPGETLGLVGESGCGKSTIGRCIVRLLEPTEGHIRLMGKDVTHRAQWRLGDMRRFVQMVFQDPGASLDPRMTVRHLISEPMDVQRIGSRQFRRSRVDTLLDLVGLPRTAASKFPHEFSGGQRQRIGIARALALSPKLLVLDEPVSALDVSVQSQVLNLLLDLQKELGLAYLFISHDLSVVRHMADRVAVMYLGKIVEMGESDLIYHDPRHAYTKALISAIPMPDPTHINTALAIPGDVPSPIDPPPGSAFGRRINHPYLEATYGMDLTPVEIEPGHWVAPDPCAISLGDLAKLGIDIYQ